MIVAALYCMIGVVGAEPDSRADEFARRLWSVADAVRANHVEAPERTRTILAALNGLYRTAGVFAPEGLERRLAAVANPGQLGELLAELPRPTAPRGEGRAHDFHERLLDAVLRAVPGGARLVPAKEAVARRQLANNRYVGIQVSVGLDAESNRPVLTEIYPGGPAERAGLQAGDLVEEVDGVPTAGRSLAEILDLLRGDAGSAASLLVRPPGEGEPRRVSIVRRELARRTLKGPPGIDGTSAAPLLPGVGRVGYLSFEHLVGSTPSELRTLLRRLEEAEASALVLDLRPLALGRVDHHATVLAADCLLERGVIGRMRTADRVFTYRAEPEAHLLGRPTLILVDDRTPPSALWLAAALQDNRRAEVVARAPAGLAPEVPGPRSGAPDRTSANRSVRALVPVDATGDSIELVVGRLERGDGRPLGGLDRGGVGAVAPDVPVRPKARSARDAVFGDDVVLAAAVARLRATPRTDSRPTTTED